MTSHQTKVLTSVQDALVLASDQLEAVVGRGRQVTGALDWIDRPGPGHRSTPGSAMQIDLLLRRCSQ